MSSEAVNTNDIDAALAHWIDTALREGRTAGVTNIGLAAVLGVDPTQITRMRSGERAIKAHELPLIEGYLGSKAPLPTSQPNTSQRTAKGSAATVAEQIREGREALGWTKQRLAEELGISHTAMSQWENPEKCPKLRNEHVIRLSELLGKPPSAFVRFADADSEIPVSSVRVSSILSKVGDLAEVALASTDKAFREATLLEIRRIARGDPPSDAETAAQAPPARPTKAM